MPSTQTRLTIASGASQSAESVVAVAGNYLYFMFFGVDITWLGTSAWCLYWDTAGAASPLTHPAPPALELGNGFGSGQPRSFGRWLSPDAAPPASMNAPSLFPSQDGFFVYRSLGAGNYSGTVAVAPAPAVGGSGGSFQIAPGTWFLRAGNVFGDGYFGAAGYTAEACVVQSTDPPGTFVPPGVFCAASQPSKMFVGEPGGDVW